MTYTGGKAGAGVYQAIINQIPPHDTFIEPFLGDGAILRRKKPAIRNVGVEIDGDVLAAWNGDPVPGLELHHCCGIEWLRHAFDLYRLRPRPEAPFIATPPGCLGTVANHGGRRRDASAGVSRSHDAGIRVEDRVEESGGSRAAPDSASTAVDAGNGDGRPAADSAAEARAACFVYADPPYPFEVRRNGAKLYRHEFTEEDHAKLLWTLKRLPCMVAVSSYWSEYYAAELGDWRLIRFRGHSRQGPTVECLWMNYPQPAELHDTRYLGRNKREREKLRRRARNWSQGLDRLPSLERQAIVDAITGRNARANILIPRKEHRDA